MSPSIRLDLGLERRVDSKFTVVSIDGTRIEVPEGMTVLSAIALAGKSYFRASISGRPRGP